MKKTGHIVNTRNFKKMYTSQINLYPYHTSIKGIDKLRRLEKEVKLYNMYTLIGSQFLYYLINPITNSDQSDFDQRSAIRFDRIAIDRRSEKTLINKPDCISIACGVSVLYSVCSNYSDSFPCTCVLLRMGRHARHPKSDIPYLLFLHGTVTCIHVVHAC